MKVVVTRRGKGFQAVCTEEVFNPLRWRWETWERIAIAGEAAFFWFWEDTGLPVKQTTLRRFWIAHSYFRAKQEVDGE